MGIIDNIEDTDDYSVFPRKRIEDRIKELDAYPNKDDFGKCIYLDKNFQDNIHKLYDIKLLEEMQNFNKITTFGSGKVRRIDAGVKTMKFSQEVIDRMIKYGRK